MTYSIREFLKNPKVNSDEFYGFYDWFCSDSSLKKRMLALVPKIKFLVKMNILDQDNTYIWLKNNCPMNGSLYDDIRISTIKDDVFLGGFCPRTGHKNAQEKCSVWTLNPYITYDFINWTEFKSEVKNCEEFRDTLKKTFNPKNH